MVVKTQKEILGVFNLKGNYAETIIFRGRGVVEHGSKRASLAEYFGLTEEYYQVSQRPTSMGVDTVTIQQLKLDGYGYLSIAGGPITYRGTDEINIAEISIRTIPGIATKITSNKERR